MSDFPGVYVPRYTGYEETAPNLFVDPPPWQAIETAPKDGTLFIGWNGRRVDLWMWRREHHYREAAWYSVRDINHIDQPTHWMALPEPPK